MGRVVIVAEDGVTKIRRAIKDFWAGKLEISVTELHRDGSERDGVLARALTESM